MEIICAKRKLWGGGRGGDQGSQKIIIDDIIIAKKTVKSCGFIFNFSKQNYLYHYQDTGLEYRLLENHIRVLLHTTSFLHFKRRAKKKEIMRNI